jgi:hypothetical protein
MKTGGFKELSDIHKPFEHSLIMTKGHKSVNLSAGKNSAKVNAYDESSLG